MSTRRWNWPLWAGFVTCLIAFVSYPFVFVRFPITRDVPWVNYLLFAAGLIFLASGLGRAYRNPQQFRGRVAGPVLSLLSFCVLGYFCYLVFFLSRQLPASAGAPRIGQKAPEFELPDVNDKPVSLSSLLSSPIANSQAPAKGVLLVFYRGYW